MASSRAAEGSPGEARGTDACKAPTSRRAPPPNSWLPQDAPPCGSLLEAVKAIKPTVLIGLSDKAPPHAFSKEVREAGGRAGWVWGRCGAGWARCWGCRSHVQQGGLWEGRQRS